MGDAYELNKFNNFNFEILVESDKWLETKFIDFPNTKSSKKLFDKYIDIPSIDATKPSWLSKLNKNKNYWVEEEIHHIILVNMIFMVHGYIY